MKNYFRFAIAILMVYLILFGISSPGLAATNQLNQSSQKNYSNGTLVKIKGQSTVYVIYNGQKLPIRSKIDFDKLGFSNYQVKIVAASDIKPYKVGSTLAYVSIGEGSLIQTNNDKGVYLIEDNYRRPIKSPDVFKARGYDWKEIKQLHSLQFNRYPLGAPITSKERRDGQLVRTEDNPTVYLLENGQKKSIISAPAFETRGYDWKLVKYIKKQELNGYPQGETINSESKSTLAKISSCDDLLRVTTNIPSVYYNEDIFPLADVAQPSGRNNQSNAMNEGLQYGNIVGWGIQETPVFSTTNIQVQGVDEPDLVKTDGIYLYSVSIGNVVISRGWPLDQAEKLSTIEKINDFLPSEIFISGNRLAVIGMVMENNDPQYILNRFFQEQLDVSSYGYWFSNTRLYIYDITDRYKPVLKRALEFSGRYKTSRLVDNELYLIMDNQTSYSISSKNDNNIEKILPTYRQAFNNDKLTPPSPLTTCERISYINPVKAKDYLIVVNVNVADDQKRFNPLVIIGGVDETYVSNNHIYLARSQYNPSENNLVGSKTQTNVYRVNLTPGDITLSGSAIVPGNTLNQFTMDEWDGHFRIATTARLSKFNNQQSSNVFIFDDGMNLVGSVQNLAPGEEIYAARFLGNKGFLVTFRQIDPFFSLDLSDHKNPRLVGELKIPGFSTYLHPYDENHIIGLGENTDNNGFGTSQGVKLALFDLTDLANPKEMASTTVASGDAVTPAGKDHRAFLFDRNKNLLVIPVTTMDEANSSEAVSSRKATIRHEAYVYKLTLDKGFELMTKISHFPEGTLSIDNYSIENTSVYFQLIENYILRSLYIQDYLYTYSPGKWGITSLIDYLKIKEIPINNFQELFKQEIENAKNKEIESKRISDIKQIQTAFELYFNDLNKYPLASTQQELGVDLKCLGDNGLDKSCTGMIYMSRIPSDPETPDKKYIILPNNDNIQRYCIIFELGMNVSSLKKGLNYATPNGISGQGCLK